MEKFSLEVKLEDIQHYLKGEESYRAIGNRIGTHHKFIMKWIDLYKKIWNRLGIQITLYNLKWTYLTL